MARLGRFAPVLGLFFLAPWVGEYLLGNVSVRQIFALPILALLYGSGALLIREVARRTGRGWPTMLLLGAAYGVIEAGLVDQSLFNPSFETWDFLAVTPIPALGISAFNAMSFVVGHAIWSIGIPIAIVELLTPSRRTTPWLGKVGLGVTAAFYILGCINVFRFLYRAEGFLASPGQLAGAAAVAVLLIGLAFAVKPRPVVRTNRRVPSPRLLGIGTFLLSSLYSLRSESWGGVGLGIVLLTLAALLVAFWSRGEGWGIMHQFALVAGALLNYAWLGYALTALTTPGDPVRWAGNLIFTLVAIGLLWWVARVAGQSRGEQRTSIHRELAEGAA